MNFEEKVISMLDSMKTEIADMKSDITGMKTEIAGMKSDITSMKADMKQLQDDLAIVKEEGSYVKDVVTRMELEHGKKLDALFDGYTENFKIISKADPRMTKAEREIERLTFEVNYLKSAQ